MRDLESGLVRVLKARNERLHAIVERQLEDLELLMTSQQWYKSEFNRLDSVCEDLVKQNRNQEAVIEELRKRIFESRKNPEGQPEEDNTNTPEMSEALAKAIRELAGRE